MEIIAEKWGFVLTKPQPFAYNIPKFDTDPRPEGRGSGGFAL